MRNKKTRPFLKVMCLGLALALIMEPVVPVFAVSSTTNCPNGKCPPVVRSIPVHMIKALAKRKAAKSSLGGTLSVTGNPAPVSPAPPTPPNPTPPAPSVLTPTPPAPTLPTPVPPTPAPPTQSTSPITPNPTPPALVPTATEPPNPPLTSSSTDVECSDPDCVNAPQKAQWLLNLSRSFADLSARAANGTLTLEDIESLPSEVCPGETCNPQPFLDQLNETINQTESSMIGLLPDWLQPLIRRMLSGDFSLTQLGEEIGTWASESFSHFLLGFNQGDSSLEAGVDFSEAIELIQTIVEDMFITGAALNNRGQIRLQEARQMLSRLIQQGAPQRANRLNRLLLSVLDFRFSTNTGSLNLGNPASYTPDHQTILNTMRSLTGSAEAISASLRNLLPGNSDGQSTASLEIAFARLGANGDRVNSRSADLEGTDEQKLLTEAFRSAYLTPARWMLQHIAQGNRSGTEWTATAANIQNLEDRAVSAYRYAIQQGAPIPGGDLAAVFAVTDLARRYAGLPSRNIPTPVTETTPPDRSNLDVGNSEQYPNNHRFLVNTFNRIRDVLEESDERIKYLQSDRDTLWLQLSANPHLPESATWYAQIQEIEASIRIHQGTRNWWSLRFLRRGMSEGMPPRTWYESLLRGEDLVTVSDETRRNTIQSFRSSHLRMAWQMITDLSSNNAPVTPDRIRQIEDAAIRDFQAAGQTIPPEELGLILSITHFARIQVNVPRNSGSAPRRIPFVLGGIAGNLTLNETWRTGGIHYTGGEAAQSSNPEGWSFTHISFDFESTERILGRPRTRTLWDGNKFTTITVQTDGSKEIQTTSYEAASSWTQQVVRITAPRTAQELMRDLTDPTGYSGLGTFTTTLRDGGVITGEINNGQFTAREATSGDGRVVQRFPNPYVTETLQVSNGQRVSQGWQINMNPLIEAYGRDLEAFYYIAQDMANSVAQTVLPTLRSNDDLANLTQEEVANTLYHFLLGWVNTSTGDARDDADNRSNNAQPNQRSLVIRPDGSFELKDFVRRTFSHYIDVQQRGIPIANPLYITENLRLRRWTLDVQRIRYGRFRLVRQTLGQPAGPQLVLTEPVYLRNFFTEGGRRIDPITGLYEITSQGADLFAERAYLPNGNRLSYSYGTERRYPNGGPNRNFFQSFANFFDSRTYENVQSAFVENIAVWERQADGVWSRRQSTVNRTDWIDVPSSNALATGWNDVMQRPVIRNINQVLERAGNALWGAVIIPVATRLPWSVGADSFSGRLSGVEAAIDRLRSISFHPMPAETARQFINGLSAEERVALGQLISLQRQQQWRSYLTNRGLTEDSLRTLSPEVRAVHLAERDRILNGPGDAAGRALEEEEFVRSAPLLRPSTEFARLARETDNPWLVGASVISHIAEGTAGMLPVIGIMRVSRLIANRWSGTVLGNSLVIANTSIDTLLMSSMFMGATMNLNNLLSATDLEQVANAGGGLASDVFLTFLYPKLSRIGAERANSALASTRTLINRLETAERNLNEMPTNDSRRAALETERNNIRTELMRNMGLPSSGDQRDSATLIEMGREWVRVATEMKNSQVLTRTQEEITRAQEELRNQNLDPARRRELLERQLNLEVDRQAELLRIRTGNELSQEAKDSLREKLRRFQEAQEALRNLREADWREQGLVEEFIRAQDELQLEISRLITEQRPAPPQTVAELEAAMNRLRPQIEENVRQFNDLDSRLEQLEVQLESTRDPIRRAELQSQIDTMTEAMDRLTEQRRPLTTQRDNYADLIRLSRVNQRFNEFNRLVDANQIEQALEYLRSTSERSSFILEEESFIDIPFEHFTDAFGNNLREHTRRLAHESSAGGTDRVWVPEIRVVIDGQPIPLAQALRTYGPENALFASRARSFLNDRIAALREEITHVIDGLDAANGSMENRMYISPIYRDLIRQNPNLNLQFDSEINFLFRAIENGWVQNSSAVDTLLFNHQESRPAVLELYRDVLRRSLFPVIPPGILSGALQSIEAIKNLKLLKEIAQRIITSAPCALGATMVEHVKNAVQGILETVRRSINQNITLGSDFGVVGQILVDLVKRGGLSLIDWLNREGANPLDGILQALNEAKNRPNLPQSELERILARLPPEVREAVNRQVRGGAEMEGRTLSPAEYAERARTALSELLNELNRNLRDITRITGQSLPDSSVPRTPVSTLQDAFNLSSILESLGPEAREYESPVPNSSNRLVMRYEGTSDLLFITASLERPVNGGGRAVVGEPINFLYENGRLSVDVPPTSGAAYGMMGRGDSVLGIALPELLRISGNRKISQVEIRLGAQHLGIVGELLNLFPTASPDLLVGHSLGRSLAAGDFVSFFSFNGTQYVWTSIHLPEFARALREGRRGSVAKILEELQAAIDQNSRSNPHLAGLLREQLEFYQNANRAVLNPSPFLTTTPMELNRWLLSSGYDEVSPENRQRNLNFIVNPGFSESIGNDRPRRIQVIAALRRTSQALMLGGLLPNGVKKLRISPGVDFYEARVNDNYRIIFRLLGDRLEFLSVLKHEDVQRYIDNQIASRSMTSANRTRPLPVERFYSGIPIDALARLVGLVGWGLNNLMFSSLRSLLGAMGDSVYGLMVETAQRCAQVFQRRPPELPPPPRDLSLVPAPLPTTDISFNLDDPLIRLVGAGNRHVSVVHFSSMLPDEVTVFRSEGNNGISIGIGERVTVDGISIRYLGNGRVRLRNDGAENPQILTRRLPTAREIENLTRHIPGLPVTNRTLLGRNAETLEKTISDQTSPYMNQWFEMIGNSPGSAIRVPIEVAVDVDGVIRGSAYPNQPLSEGRIRIRFDVLYRGFDSMIDPASIQGLEALSQQARELFLNTTRRPNFLASNDRGMPQNIVPITISPRQTAPYRALGSLAFQLAVEAQLAARLDLPSRRLEAIREMGIMHPNTIRFMASRYPHEILSIPILIERETGRIVSYDPTGATDSIPSADILTGRYVRVHLQVRLRNMVIDLARTMAGVEFLQQGRQYFREQIEHFNDRLPSVRVFRSDLSTPLNVAIHEHQTISYPLFQVGSDGILRITRSSDGTWQLSLTGRFRESTLVHRQVPSGGGSLRIGGPNLSNPGALDIRITDFPTTFYLNIEFTRNRLRITRVPIPNPPANPPAGG